MKKFKLKSLINKFKVQKNKYSSDKNWHLYPFMEQIGLKKIKVYFNRLLELIEQRRTLDKLAKISI
jgi:hypothetical protein